jgi:hypothetical protein
MDEKLLTKTDLAAFFQLSAESARKLCEKHGVKPLNVGTGKVSRLRWRMSDVMQVLAILQTPTGKQKEFCTRRKGDPHVLGQTAKSLHAMLAMQ